MSAQPVNDEAIFAAAIDIDDRAERQAYVETACGNDQRLRQSVGELLALHDTADGFLETPALGPAVELPTEQAGDLIDRYRLVEQVGEGGFGTVWRAEQEEPVCREVALKIIKAGLDSQQIIARFQLERQTLAIMNHPNVATVLDAGTYECPVSLEPDKHDRSEASDIGATRVHPEQKRVHSRPYFVMELVDGRAIDAFCDEQKVAIGERLKLFAEVCRAVHHAHQKGIIHRDLKPSNILVATGDGRSVPKIIDFGIAKAMHGPDTNDESVIAERQLVGTLQYMSPEQFASAPDIDTRADVYALGGVLYKLLVGAAPLETDSIRQAGFEELAQAIRQVEPVPPSQRLLQCRQVPPNPESADVASEERPVSRVVEEEGTRVWEKPDYTWGRSLRGDLDWIVMKALAKDRECRYASTAELALDVERHLAGEPVAAAPHSTAYRLKKFVRRNSFAVAAAFAVLVALLAGSVAATVGFVRADRERQYATQQWQRAEVEQQNAEQQRNAAQTERTRAVLEADKALRIVEMLEDMIGAANPDQGRPADFTLRQQLDAFAESIGKDLADYPHVEARLRGTIGRLYLTLREFDKAGPHLKRTRDLRRDLYPANDPRSLQSTVDYAWFLYFTSRVEEAAQSLTACLPPLRDSGPSEELASALDLAGRIHTIQDDRAERDRLLLEAWSVARELHGDEHPVVLIFQARVAAIVYGKGEPQEAERLARDAIARLRGRGPEEHIHIAWANVCLGKVLLAQNRLEEAESLVRAAMQIHRRQIGEDSIFVIRDLVTLGRILRDSDRRDEALDLVREAVEKAERCEIEGDRQQIHAYRALAMLSDDPQLVADARAKAIAAQRRLIPNHPSVVRGLSQLGFLLRRLERWDESAACYRDAIAVLHGMSERSAATAYTLHALADMLSESEDSLGAEAYLREAIAIEELEAPHRDVMLIDLIATLIELDDLDAARQQVDELAAASEPAAVVYATQAQLLMADSDFAAAQQLLHRALDDFAQTGEEARRTSRIRRLLAQCHMQMEQFEAAENILLSAVRATNRRPFRPIDQRRSVLQLIDLYEAWPRPEKANRWRQRLNSVPH